ncbi:MAG: tRNA uridine-5-carboxymethylaminomethyl(34) synthesis GTPase MnmE [Betaproteobacteria bacterium]|nr:tRNA uridine-5-carboxymethylaminomethyl(34) synthesis GTPase MnmE [Betaproteobacteria bacterium]
MSNHVSRETTETIAAIATATGRGGVGVVRVSGNSLARLAEGVCGKVPAPRVATHVVFRDHAGRPIDDGLILFFPGPRSYTGEDVIELHGHGGAAALGNILRRCLQLGCRLAKPGEFTERAFLNDKLDLAEAEAVADLIEAGSAQAAMSAAQTLTGEFSRRIHRLTEALIDLRMHVEACIDFPEEEIDPADRLAQAKKLEHIQELEAGLAREAALGRVLRDGLTVVLIGRPNVGKSSLLNRLAGEELAIVTPIPGTTRDHIRATIHLDGVPIHLIDTAGLRDTEDEVERIGIDRTWAAIAKAGAALLISEAGEMAGIHEAEILHRLPKGLPVAWVYNKIDLFRPASVPRETRNQRDAEEQTSLSVSALTGEGVDDLRAWLLTIAGWQSGAEGVFLARERHLVALRLAASHLSVASSLASQYELFAEELRLAQRALSSITGEFSSDDLLGEIFGRFCIGK